MSCFCSRRRSRQQAPLKAPALAVSIKAPADFEVRGAAPNLRDLSDEVLSAVLLCLHGAEVAARLGPAARFIQHRLDEDVSNPLTSLWSRFMTQEFQRSDLWTPGRTEAAKASYKVLTQRRRCKTIEWRRLPCNHTLGAREGSPGMFFRSGRVFVLGGWGAHGPMGDLHVGPLAAPLRLEEVDVEGRGPPATYEGKFTVLDEEDRPEEGDFKLQVLVTGGYLHGGYFGESSTYGLMEITGVGADVRARWVRTGDMKPRSNHSATYVPPRIAGPAFPSGYVLVFGGNWNGRVCSSLDLLDLSTWTWMENISCDGDPPQARNSHSATLLRCQDGDGILIIGGGSGDERNGGPPRGGQDLSGVDCGATWLLGLDGFPQFRWKRQALACEVHGRGHVAARLSGTDTVVLVSGGRSPSSHCTAIASTHQARMESMGHSVAPVAVAFGGGCSLPNGMILVYGGWNPRHGTYTSFWTACVDEVGSKSDFFQQLENHEPEAEHESSDDDSMFDIPGLLRMARVAQGRLHPRLQLNESFAAGYQSLLQGAEDDDEDVEENDEVDDQGMDVMDDTSSSQVDEAALWDLSDD